MSSTAACDMCVKSKWRAAKWLKSFFVFVTLAVLPYKVWVWEFFSDLTASNPEVFRQWHHFWLFASVDFNLNNKYTVQVQTFSFNLRVLVLHQLLLFFFNSHFYKTPAEKNQLK